MSKIFAVLLVIIMICSVAACADTTVKGSVVSESVEGDAELDIMPQKLFEKVSVGDIAVVTIGDFCKEMPLVEKPIEEDGKFQLVYDKETHAVNICMYNQHFCEVCDIEVGAKVKIRKKD